MDSNVRSTDLPSTTNDDPHTSTQTIPSNRSISPLTRVPLEENEPTSNSRQESYPSIEASLNGTSRSYTEDSAFGDEENDERQPLLVVRSSESVDEIAKEYFSFENNKAFVYTLLILLGLGFFFYLTFQQLDSLVMLAIDTKFQSLSIMDLNNDGLDFHVLGSVSMHYGNIGNHFYRFFMKLASVIIGSVIVIPNDAVKLFASLQGRNESLHVLNIYPPDIQVDIANNALTEIDFISKSELIKENIVELLNTLEEINDEEVVVKLTGIFDSTIESKLFEYSTKNARFYLDYSLNKTDLAPTVLLDKLTVQQNPENSTEIEFYSTISMDNKFPIKAELEAIDWDISIAGCNKELVKLGEWHSSSLSIQPDSRVEFDVNGLIREIPDKLLQNCDNNITIINKLVQDYLKGKATAVTISASNNLNNQENLPKWLLYVLNKAGYKLLVSLPYFQDDTMSYIKEYDISSLFLEFLSPKSRELFSYALSSNVSMITTFPGIFDITFGVPRFQNSISLRDESETLIKGWSNTNNTMDLHRYDDENLLEWDIAVSNFEADSVGPARLGALANNLLNGNDIADSMYLDMILDEVELSMLILTTTLKHLILPSVQLNPPIETINSIDDVIDTLNITVDNILYVDSSKEELRLMIDCSLLNPTNISIDVPDDTISLQLRYNDTIIGNVSTTDILIPQTGEYFNMTFNLNLNTTTTHGKVLLEFLIGEFISGYEDLYFSVEGTNTSSSNNHGLSKFLSQIAINDIQVPNVSFSPERVQNLPHPLDHHPKHQSPFLIDATIHIFSSELELTLFNPLENAEIAVKIYQAQASYENTKLGHVQPDQYLLIPPGVYTTPRIPFVMDSNIGMDILRKALNGSLRVQVLAVFKANIGEFDLLLLYEGSDLSAAIRW